MRKPDGQVDVDAVLLDDKIIERAGKQAVREAQLDHKRAGRPLVVWQDCRVVWIPADQIEIDDDPPKHPI